jgi:hypothetical protein
MPGNGLKHLEVGNVHLLHLYQLNITRTPNRLCFTIAP